MNLFKKKKPTRVVDDTESIVTDFRLRSPFWCYRAVSYRVWEPFAGYGKTIDSYLEKLFEGEIDDGNGDVLDNMICDMARQAERDLDRQHTEHGDIIRTFGIRSQGDRRAFVQERGLLQSALDETEQHLDEVRARMRKDEFRGGEPHERKA